jgi:hypothetical protein
MMAPPVDRAASRLVAALEHAWSMPGACLEHAWTAISRHQQVFGWWSQADSPGGVGGTAGPSPSQTV